MFSGKIHTTAVILIAIFFAMGCSQYTKVLKTDDVNRKIEMAYYYYDKGDHTKAGALFDQLAPLVSGTQRADSVFYYMAMNSYKMYDYMIAAHYFNQFVELYGNSVFAEDAAYMEAYSYYMISPRPELDQTDTYKAMQALQLFMIRYPDSPKMAECQRIVLELREKLMEKSFISAELYFNMGDYKASITALNNCIAEFPDTEYREDILFMLLKSRYMFAVNSIPDKRAERYQETIDEYYSFIAEYPESKNKKEADDMYESSSEFVEDLEEISTINN